MRFENTRDAPGGEWPIPGGLFPEGRGGSPGGGKYFQYLPTLSLGMDEAPTAKSGGFFLGRESSRRLGMLPAFAV